MQIGDIEISLSSYPAIIAEMSGNHNQSLDRAFKIIDVAVDSGAKFIKLQTYTPNTITLDINSKEFIIKSSNKNWNNKSLYSLYSEAYTPWEWQKEIFEKCKQKGIVCFSSAFDESSVEFLEEIGSPAYKIASQECIHLPLLREVALTGKPIIISTGMATLAEIDEAINLIKRISSSNIALLKCTSTYPANPKDSNIKTIEQMRSVFGCEVGISDHTPGIGVAVAAVAMGATLIEKHVTLSRADGGVDSAFSLEPHELKNLVNETKTAKDSIGKVHFGPTISEIESLTGRRSIYISEDIKKGEKFTINNVKIVRPNLGLAPKYYEKIIGRVAKKDIKRGTPLSWELF